jgi:copper(I)-binding protein
MTCRIALCTGVAALFATTGPAACRHPGRMLMMKLKMLAAALVAAACVANAAAHEYKVQDLLVDHPWSRATPQGAKVGSGYLVIRNNGKSADRLVSVSSPNAGKVEIHQMTTTGGVMKMRPVEGGIAVQPGKTVELKPGGYHLMFMDLPAPFKQGDKIPATLEFEKAGKVDVEFNVEARGGKAHKGHGR